MRDSNLQIVKVEKSLSLWIEENFPAGISLLVSSQIYDVWIFLWSALSVLYGYSSPAVCTSPTHQPLQDAKGMSYGSSEMAMPRCQDLAAALLKKLGGNFPHKLYKEIWKGAGAKSCMRKSFLIYEEMREYLVIYKEVVSHVWLCTGFLNVFHYF